MDKRFHRGLHVRAFGRRDFAVRRVDRTFGHHLNALLDDAERLAHFIHADEIAIIAIAVLADGNVEVEFRINFVRLRAAQIPRHAGAAHHDAGKAPGLRIFRRHDADVGIALHENAVAREQRFEIVEHLLVRAAEIINVAQQFRRHILMDATGTEIGRVHTRARGAFIEHHQVFTFDEAPERRRQCADVHRLRCRVEDVRHQAADLGEDHADELRTARHRDAEQFLNREAIGVFLIHRCAIIEPVEIRQCLQEGFGFDQLFSAAMEETDMRIDALDDFAFKLQHEAQHAMRCRMLRTEIQREGAEFLFGCELVHGFGSAFSSPGRMYSAPSQGDRKSNVRNSCVSLTGS